MLDGSKRDVRIMELSLLGLLAVLAGVFAFVLDEIFFTAVFMILGGIALGRALREGAL
jgi:hypothetical protein